METLDLKQREWVLKQVGKLLQKYHPLFPLSEDGWNELCNDVKKTAKLSKNNENVKEILFVVLEFFEKLDETYRKCCNENTG